MNRTQTNPRPRSSTGSDWIWPEEERVARLEQRLACLERRQGRLLRVAGVASLALVAAVTMGVAASVPDVLSARSFELVDASGHVRASWSTRDDDGAAIAVFDDDGKEATALQMTVADPYLEVVSAQGAPKQARGRSLFSWGNGRAEQDNSPAPDQRPSWAGQKPAEDDPGFDWENK